LLLKVALVGGALGAAGCGMADGTSSVSSALNDAASDADAGEHPDANAEAAIGNDSDLGEEAAPDAAVEADDPAALVVFPAQFIDEHSPMRMLADGDPVDLWSAPQGGHVVLIGAKVRNLNSDTAMLRARFRNPSNRFIIAEDGRTVKMLPVPGEPGMMQPDIRSFSQVANAPVCPSYNGMGIVDGTFDVEVTVTALYTDPVQTGGATIRVVARCSTPDDEAHCRCDCGPDYYLGKCGFGPRGGVDAAMPGPAQPF
jgi:hypothetical protein